MQTQTTIEKMRALYYSDALIEPVEKLYRMQNGGDRYYYLFDGASPLFFMSVTTFIKKAYPANESLTKWIASRGYEDAKRYTLERSHYGTFVHGEIASLLISGTYNLDSLHTRLAEYSEKYNFDLSEHEEEMKKDILAFAQFAIDYNVKPIAVEACLYHPDGYAGAIDIVCEMDHIVTDFFGEVYKSGEKKGQPKLSKQVQRVIAIVDIKSGRKGFYAEHECQLHAYKNAWNYHYPEQEVQRVYNWSPKEWRLTPGYNLKDQTDSEEQYKLPHFVAIAKIEDKKLDRLVRIYSGRITLNDKSLAGNISFKSLSEIALGSKEYTKRGDLNALLEEADKSNLLG